MPRRIVVTGASGNVGTAVLRSLAQTHPDDEIVGVVRRAPAPVGVYRSVDWHQVDLGSPGIEAGLRRIFAGADCVVHTAWGFQPTRNHRYLFDVAIGGSSAVLRAAHDAGVAHLVHISSLGTYAAGRYGRKVDETWSTAGLPSSVYSQSKAAVEAMLDGYQRRNPDGVGITRMRPGLIVQRKAAAGLRRYTLPAYLNPRWLRWLPLLPLDRSLVVPLVHTDDVADAIVRAIDRRALGPFNLAAEPPIRRDDIAAALGARPVHVSAAVLRLLVQATWRLGLQPIDRGWLDMAFSVPLLASDRARAELGWTPRWGSREALAEVVEGLLAGSGAPSPVLRPRSFAEAIRRDLADGPLTRRRVP